MGMPTLTLARYILETSLLFFEFNRIPGSLVASGAYLLAARMKGEADWVRNSMTFIFPLGIASCLDRGNGVSLGLHTGGGRADDVGSQQHDGGSRECLFQFLQHLQQV